MHRRAFCRYCNILPTFPISTRSLRARYCTWSSWFHYYLLLVLCDYFHASWLMCLLSVRELSGTKHKMNVCFHSTNFVNMCYKHFTIDNLRWQIRNDDNDMRIRTLNLKTELCWLFVLLKPYSPWAVHSWRILETYYISRLRTELKRKKRFVAWKWMLGSVFILQKRFCRTVNLTCFRCWSLGCGGCLAWVNCRNDNYCSRFHYHLRSDRPNCLVHSE